MDGCRCLILDGRQKRPGSATNVQYHHDLDHQASRGTLDEAPCYTGLGSRNRDHWAFPLQEGTMPRVKMIKTSKRELSLIQLKFKHVQGIYSS